MSTHPLLAYLDSVARWYPFGIPKSLATAATPPRRVSFVWLERGWSGAWHEGSAGSLLNAAITQGLKLSPEAVTVRRCGTPEEVKEAISAAVGVVVLLGSHTRAAVSETGSDLPETTVVTTSDPTQVTAEPGLKRQFWAELQRILPLISGHP